MQKGHVQKIRWRQNEKCIANASDFEFWFGSFFKFLETPKESDRRQECAETARAENSVGGKMVKV